MTSDSAQDDRGFEAFKVYSDRWCKAMICLDEKDQPSWLRTTNAMKCFDKLPLNGLPVKWSRRANTCFRKINRISEGYSIQTWEDYQKVSEADLIKIQNLIWNLIPRVRR